LAIYPDTRVQVVDDHYEALLRDLRAGKLDILFGVLRRPAWAADTFANPYAAVARSGHPLARRHHLSLRDLAGYDWVLPDRGAPRREAFERLFHKIRVIAAGQHRDHLAGGLSLNSRLQRSHCAVLEARNRARRVANRRFDDAAVCVERAVAQ
jgi:hypothetical protein